MALKSDEKIITKVCKYWSKNEPEVCEYWDSGSTKCTNNNEIRPTYFPNCNLIGTAHQCNLYTGKKTEARCILPDPLRGGTNRKTGQRWITRDKEDKTKFIGFDDITCYGYYGFCDGDPENNGNGYGVGDGLSSKCSGYNPSELEFSNYFDNLPLDLQIYNLCGKLGRCLWWASNATMFTLDDDGGIEYPTNICVHKDEGVKKFKTIRYDEEKGIFILPCNGAASSCPFYTGIKWEYCITDKLYPGCKILAEQIQEIRYYLKKNNWTEKSFSETFYEPIIYAWDKSKGYKIDKINSENKNSTNIFFPQYNQTPSVVSVIEVKIPKFSSFNLEFRNIELTKGTKEREINIDYPTLIEQLPLLPALPPLILNEFDTEEGDTEYDYTGNDNNVDEEKNNEKEEKEEKTNIFEMVDIHDNTILLIGETRYYNSKPYAVNLTLDTITDFPIELHTYESLFDIRNDVSDENYKLIYNQIDNRLTYYINYNQKPLGVNNTPKIEDDLVGGEFFINVETVIGDNTILVFDKGSGYWEYSKVNVKVNYHGVVIAQTEFHVESFGENIEYPPYYPASFCGIENSKSYHDNKYIKFELKTFGGGETEIAHVYNDYVIENDYDTKEQSITATRKKKYEAGYIPYEVEVYTEFELKYDDGNIIPIGNAGYLLLIIPDNDKLLHSTYRPWEIKGKKDEVYMDEDDVVLNMEFSAKEQIKDKNNTVIEGQKTNAQLKKEAEDKTFKLEVFMTGGKYLPNNQMIVRPKDIYKFQSVGPGCFIVIGRIIVYEKRSFVKASGDQETQYKDLKIGGKEIDYIKQAVKIKDVDYATDEEELKDKDKHNEYCENGIIFKDEIIPKEEVFFKGETKLDLTDKTHGTFTSITDETLFIAVAFKSALTGRILGVTRTKMIVWVRNPSCRAAPIFYKWATEYEEFDLVPLQYYRFDDVGILKKPMKDSYINIKYTPGFGDFIMHPFVFAPTKVLYTMDPDVIDFLDAEPKDYVIEYYRTLLLSGLTTVYENDWEHGNFSTKCTAPWEYIKVVEMIGDPQKIIYTVKDIKHGYYDMCKLSSPKNNVTVWYKGPVVGSKSFCASQYGPANLVGKNPPDFIGAALYYAGISTKYYGYCIDNWSPGIVKAELPSFTMEYNYGKFGGGTREVMDSYRSVDNICYDTGIVEFEENFKDMIAFERLKTGDLVSKLEEDLYLWRIKMKDQKYFFRRWMPMYDTFSASDLNSNLIDHPFNEYTFDLKSPYYHPLSLYTVSTIDGNTVDEIIEPGYPNPPKNYDSEKNGEYIPPKFKKSKFDEVFEHETFENTFLGEMKPDGTYDEFEGAIGITYPNKSRQEIDYPNDVWLTFKAIDEIVDLGQGETTTVSTKNVQWAWREREATIDRYVNSEDLKDYVSELIETQQNEDLDFSVPTINAPYVMVDGDEKDVTGIFQWLPIKHPDCFFDYYLKEWDLTIEGEEEEEGEEGEEEEGDDGTKINVLFLEDKEDKNNGEVVPRDGIFFIQLNDGPPRGIDKNGYFDPVKMLELRTINDFKIPDLHKLYTTCTKNPWSNKVTLFDKGYDSIEVQDAIDDDRYYYLEKPFRADNAKTDNKFVFQRGLSTLSGTVVSGIGIDNFNAEDLPSIKNLIGESTYEIKASHTPEKDETRSSYTSIEPNEWFPNSDYCCNIVYKNDKCTSIDVSFRFRERKDISKIICQFKCGKNRVTDRDLKWTDKDVITDNLYNAPGVNIEINNNIVYSSDIIEFYVEGKKELNKEKKRKFINGDVEDSVEGSVKYVDSSDNINEIFKIYEWPVNLLEDTTRSKELTISFRIDPNYTELKNVNFIDTKYVFENKSKIIYTKHCLHLDCIYLYNSKLVNAYEKIKVNNRGYFTSIGSHGDFQSNKFDVSNIERAFLKAGNGKNRIPTLTQVDNFDGMISYPFSDGECTSISKCRSRLMGKVQTKERESFVKDGEGYGDEVDNSTYSGKSKKTLNMCEKKQNKLYQDAIDKGVTEFRMKSICPPGLKLILDGLDNIEFPEWECKFTNKMVLPLCEPLDIEPIEPEGYYFDWGFDNIIQRPCFSKKYSQWAPNSSFNSGWGIDASELIDCFDGYKLKSYYDQGDIVGVSAAEIWATAPGGAIGSEFVRPSSVLERKEGLSQIGWTKTREQDDDKNKEFYDTLIELQTQHAFVQESMRSNNEQKIEDLESENLTTLNNLFIEYGVKINAEEDAAKVDMEVEYDTKKYDMIIEQQTILKDTNITQIIKWSELIVTQYAEIGSKKLVFITPLGISFKFKDNGVSFQKKFDFDTKQTVEKLQLEKEYDIDKIKLEKYYSIKIIETKDRHNYTIAETEYWIEEREKEQKKLEDECIKELEKLEEEYNYYKKKLIEEQKEVKEEYYEDNAIALPSLDDLETFTYLTMAMYGYGTQAENREFMFADITSMSDVVVDTSSKFAELIEYGKGELFELQREAYYKLLKEKDLTTDIFPAPIMAYYIKKKEEEEEEDGL